MLPLWALCYVVVVIGGVGVWAPVVALGAPEPFVVEVVDAFVEYGAA